MKLQQHTNQVLIAKSNKEKIQNYITLMNPQPLPMYCLFILHKPVCAIRPIVACQLSTFYNVIHRLISIESTKEDFTMEVNVIKQIASINSFKFLTSY